MNNDILYEGNIQDIPYIPIVRVFSSSPLKPHTSLILHVPSTTKSLISVIKFAKDNYILFEFHGNRCHVKFQRTNDIIFHVHVGIYGLN